MKCALEIPLLYCIDKTREHVHLLKGLKVLKALFGCLVLLLHRIVFEKVIFEQKDKIFLQPVVRHARRKHEFSHLCPVGCGSKNMSNYFSVAPTLFQIARMAKPAST